VNVLAFHLHKGLDVSAGARIAAARMVRYAPGFAYFSHATPASDAMEDRSRRRVGRPPAGAKNGEKVTDYPQLSIRVPQEFKARLNAMSAVTGLSQWRVIVEAIDCFFQDLPPTDRELVDGLSERLLRAG
jgi:predicted DNA-binding protein